VELKDESFTGELQDTLAKIKKTVEGKLKSVLNVRANVELVEKGTLPRTEGKAKKAIDLRQI
jgi:phenylacetate-CoA ligase